MSDDEGGIALPLGRRSSSQGLLHASYTQRKLEKFYDATYIFLLGSRDVLLIVQQVLVWNKPLASAALFLAVHWLFVVVAQTHLSLLSHLGKLLLLFIVLDILRRAASKKSDSTHKSSSSTRTSTSKPRLLKPVPFEDALLRSFAPLKAGELLAYEVVCLWLAKGLMWLENFYIALRYWSIEEPNLFFVCVLTPGIFLSLLGKYVPTIVVAYVLVMALLTLPYVEYHDLRVKVFIFFQTRYPQVLTRVSSYWDSFKSFVSKDSTDFHEVSLHSFGDERSTAQALQDAFVQVTSLPNSRRASEEIMQAPIIEPHQGSFLSMDELSPHDPVDPGLSILQDSALGMHSQAFHSVDDSLSFGSISLGAGDFPSMSLEQSISLPHFPLESRSPNRGNLREHSAMNLNFINEEEEISLPGSCNTRDLDPFADSIEVGVVDCNRPDGAQTHNNPSHPGTNNRFQQPLSSSSNLQPCPSPSYLDQITEVPASQVGLYAAGVFVPPPTYQAATEGYDNAVYYSNVDDVSSPLHTASSSTARSSSRSSSSSAESSEALAVSEKGGYYLRRR